MLGIDEKRGTTTLCSGSKLYGKDFSGHHQQLA
jgi:hypothetical protein